MSAAQMTGPESWVDRHGDALYRYALVRTRDASVAEEIVQETLLAALQSYSRFAAQSSERTWLIGILKHKLIDYYRRISRQSQFRDTDDEQFEHDELFQQEGEWVGHWNFDIAPNEWHITPETAIERAEFWQSFNNCLSELPARLATAFTLREMEQLDSEEICKILDVTTTNLWVMLHRARAHLRNCLQVNWFNLAQ
ncbi:MAG TPA: sigma-70 family RNA polymerase sigma factor [Blastocatellia bacterium]|nr:sigma-70 family RNA polymerase sigma factor [Blastocatellia bacterium]